MAALLKRRTLADRIDESRRDVRELQKLLLTEHPLYTEYKGQWQFYNDSYLGGMKYRNAEYLQQYVLENAKFFEARKQRAFYLNMCKHPINFYISTLYRVPPKLLTASEDGQVPPHLTPLLYNADMQGTNFDLFMSNATRSALIFGHSFIFLDVLAPPDGTEILTEADRLYNNVRPFCNILTPINVTNWSLDRTGSIDEAIIMLLRYQPYQLGTTATYSAITPEYWVYTKSHYEVFDYNLTQIAGGPNPFGDVIPLIPVYHIKVEPMLGESLLVDAADVNKTIYNWCSSIDESMCKQMFAQAVIKSKDKPSSIGVGTDWAVHLRPDKDEDFGYVAPPVDPIEVGWRSVQKLSEYIYTLTGLKQIAQVIAGQYYNQSGVAKAWDFSEVEKLLSDKAAYSEDAANAVIALYNIWHGAPRGRERYVLSRDYTIDSVASEVDTASKAMTLDLPPTAMGEIYKNLVNTMLPGLPEDTLRKIHDEIREIIQRKSAEKERPAIELVPAEAEEQEGDEEPVPSVEESD